MSEQEKRRLTEVLYSLVYAKFFQHGTDGHNGKLVIASQAVQLGYSFQMGLEGITLYRHSKPLFTVTRVPNWGADDNQPS